MFLFIVFALIAIVAALGVILSRKPVYSALFLLLNFGTLAAMYIMLQAQFLAMVQVIVYAGAIVVLFLFVIMLIGGGELASGDRGACPRRSLTSAPAPRPLAASCLSGRLLLVGLSYGLITGQLDAGPGQRGRLRRTAASRPSARCSTPNTCCPSSSRRCCCWWHDRGGGVGETRT